MAAQANAGFNFQMPGNALIFFALAGTLLGPAFRRVRGVRPWPLAAGLLAVAALGGWGLWRSWERHAAAPVGRTAPPSDAECAARLARTPAAAEPLVEMGWNAREAGGAERADRRFRLARRREPASPEILRQGYAYWRERGTDPGEMAACAAGLMWARVRPAEELFEEVAAAAGSVDFLEGMLPRPGDPRRPEWEQRLKAFRADRLR